ncbi:unnamed protein product [Cuscuta epithymum]|uniref:Integrase catalytic domain-containing protein n=1 Tax=Cuscuta epithymum TaxID=186058 RepID=A0AAV0EUK2_9ASTE|nr:unnamed protein product [Cuscuta epithymum]
MEVKFIARQCCVLDRFGKVLLTCTRTSNLYTIDLKSVQLPSSICLLSKASSEQNSLWHRRLSHLNFKYLTTLSSKKLVKGLPPLKTSANTHCDACRLGKMKRSSHKLKPVPSSSRLLQLLHMDLCGPMRVQSINGRKYTLVIVDDFSRYTWTKFLRTKDETTATIITFIRTIQNFLQKSVEIIRIDNGTEFKNQSLADFYETQGITQQFSAAKTPQQNGVVERKNRTLVEAARTSLIIDTF